MTTPRHTKTLIYLLIGTLLLTTLACNLTGQSDQGSNTEQLELELAATQLAIELTQQALAEPQQAQEQPTQPVPTSEVPDVVPQTAPNVSYEGISFYRDPALAGTVDMATIPEEQGVADAPLWTANPTYYLFSFGSYQPQGTFHQPELYIYPLADFIDLAPEIAGMAYDLQQILAAKSSDPGEIPFLPFFNAAQFFQAQVAYLDFQSGSGVRFLTMYGQAAWPVDNYSLFYTFQGITSDQKYYVSAIFPVNHPNLPDDGNEIVGEDWIGFDENFPTYLEDTVVQLNSYSADSFTPDLTQLDALIQSIQIDR
ncbi:MAG: hypothetical protein JXB38_05000 [Anaerolineales bacterium]|nr:hypothetical protein [Anaerolineales bacterium]